MKVILKSDVPNLGRAGDVKEVKNGFARNYLLPRNLVLPADAKSQKQKAFLDRVQARKIQKRKKTAEETSKAIQGHATRITMKVGEEGKLFGSVTSLHISKALGEDGYAIDKKLIQLGEPIKNLGEYEVEIRFYEGINSNIKVIVQDEHGNTTPIEPEPEPEAAEASAEDAPQAEETTEETDSAEQQPAAE